MKLALIVFFICLFRIKSQTNTKPILCFYTGYTPIVDFEKSNFSAYGSELALKSLAEELTHSFQVFVFGPTSNSELNKVSYRHMTSLNEFMDKNTIEIMIVSRFINYFIMYDATKVKKTYLWLHDIGVAYTFNNNYLPEQGTPLFKLALDFIDGIVTLTDWHKQFVSIILNIISLNKGVPCSGR